MGNGAVAPAKTPEVQAAEAAHFAAAGAAGFVGYPYGYAGWNGYTGAYPYAYGAYPYAAGLVAHTNGAVVPAKTPEVVAAEAAHFAAHGILLPLHMPLPTLMPTMALPDLSAMLM